MCFLHTPYCYYFPFLHFLPPRLPLFLSKVRPQVLSLLLAGHLVSHWHPGLLLSDWSRHLTLVSAGSKPAHTHLLRRLSHSHLFRACTCHQQTAASWWHKPPVMLYSQAITHDNRNTDPVSSSLPSAHTFPAKHQVHTIKGTYKGMVRQNFSLPGQPLLLPPFQCKPEKLHQLISCVPQPSIHQLREDNISA